MATAVTAFNDHITSFLSTVLLQPVVDWLQTNKGVMVSTEELATCLNLPLTKQPTAAVLPGMLPMQMPTVPGLLGGLAPAIDTAAKTRRATKAPKTQGDCPCEYVFTKGAVAGNKCGAPGTVSPIGNRCKSHAGKAGKGGAATAGVAPAPLAPKGVPAFGQLTVPQAQPTNQEIIAVPVPGTDFIRETTTGALLQTMPDGRCVCIGVEEGGQIIPANEEVLKFLASRGVMYQYRGTDAAATPAPVMAPAPLPALTAMPALPALPTVGQAPALPTIPTLPMFAGIPALA